MEMRTLGESGLRVSALGLGTMTWGSQNTETEAHAQMDYALDAGITFWDTAELYPVPPQADTCGRTETWIGSWLRRRGRRDAVILASKAVGRAEFCPWIRDGRACLDAANLRAALEGSLRRLGTDYLDLYQLHWPDRQANRFGQRGYHHAPDPSDTPLEESLTALQTFIQEGKVRAIGLSNETPWGVMTTLKLHETRGLPRPASIQNPYNLLNRSFETGLAEVALRENCPLLAYAPLAAGALTGKYLHGVLPPGSRRTIDPRQFRYATLNADPAINDYIHIARRYGLKPNQMAIAFILRQPFVGSVLLGATSLSQLISNSAAHNLNLSDDVLREIEAVHARYPDPCP